MESKLKLGGTMRDSGEKRKGGWFSLAGAAHKRLRAPSCFLARFSPYGTW